VATSRGLRHRTGGTLTTEQVPVRGVQALLGYDCIKNTLIYLDIESGNTGS
jgi:hypothetical protein